MNFIIHLLVLGLGLLLVTFPSKSEESDEYYEESEVKTWNHQICESHEVEPALSQQIKSLWIDHTRQRFEFYENKTISLLCQVTDGAVCLLTAWVLFGALGHDINLLKNSFSISCLRGPLLCLGNFRSFVNSNSLIWQSIDYNRRSKILYHILHHTKYDFEQIVI